LSSCQIRKMQNNHYLMAARAVAKKISDKNFPTILASEESKIRSNMVSFELKTEEADYDFFNKILKKVFNTILEKNLYNIKYITYSIKGNGYWIIYLILNDNVAEIEEYKEPNKKLKELFLQVNNAMINQKTRRKSCRDCESVINLNAFFNNPKFKYKKLDEPIKCPVCYSEKGFYSRTVQERIDRLKSKG